MRKKPGPIEFAAVLLALFPSILPANGYPTIHWLGANGTSWTAGKNWSSNASGSAPVDFSPDAYTIFSANGSTNSSATNLGGDQSVSSLTIAVPDPVGIGGGTLTVNGPVQIQTGSLTIGEGGGLVVAGSSPVPQTINALFAANTGGPNANTVSVYNLDGSNAFVASLGVGNLTSPTLLSADTEGNLHVLNEFPEAPPVVSVFAPDGTFLRNIVSTEFPYSDTLGFAVGANGTLFFSDSAASTVRVFGSNGTATGNITDGLENPIGLATSSNGTLYVANAGSGLIGIFSPEGVPAGNATASLPTLVAVGPNGTLYSPGSGSGNNFISTFAPNGTALGNITVGDSANIISLAVGPDGTLFASYQGSQAISVFSSNGTPTGNITENLSDPLGLWTGNFVTETLQFNGITLAASSTENSTLNIGTLGGNDTSASVASHFIAFGNGTATLNINLAGDTTLDAPLTGGGVQSTINQLGNGTTTVTSAESSYAGTINIHAGTLAIAGSLANATTRVHDGGRLSGDGTLGTLAIHSGGTLAPGLADGVSTITVGNSIWNGGGIVDIQFASANGTAGSGWDFISSNGSLTVNATSGDRFVIHASALDGVDFNPAAESYKWQIAHFSGNITGFAPEKFDILDSGFNGNGTFSISANSTALSLNYRTLFVWTGGNGSWSTQANWLDNARPAAGGPIQFAGFGGNSTNDTLASISGLAFTSNATGSYTLGGGNLSLGAGGITNDSRHSQTISLNIAFSEDQTIAANTANLILNGNISGGISLAKTGNRSLTLGGANTYTGLTTVSAGTLLVTGTTSSVTVNSGATLGGSGTVGNVVIDSGGTLSPGTSPGVLTITGNLNLSDGSNTIIEFAGPTDFDRIVVSGTATLNGTLTLCGTISVGVRYDFLRAGTILGDFDSILAPAGMRLSALNNGTEIVFLFSPASFTDYAINQNQRNLAEALNSFIPATGGDEQTVAAALDLLTAAQYPVAFDAIMPGFYETLGDMVIEQAYNQTQLLNQRLSSVRLGTSGFQAIGMSQPLKYDIDGDSVAEASTLDFVSAARGENGIWTPARIGRMAGSAPTAPAPYAPLGTNWNSWVMGIGEFAMSRGLSGVPNYNNNAGGFLAGADYRFGPTLSAGVYAGYQYNYAKYDNGSSTQGNSALFGLYASYANEGGYYADAVIGGGYTGFQTRRSIEFPGIDRTATADPGSGQFSAALNLGKDFQVGKFTLGPIAGAQYTYAGIGSFTESGADSLNLSLDQQNVNSLRTNLGARLAYNWEICKNTVLIPEVRGFWMHEFLNNPANITSSLNGGAGPTFDYETETPYRDSIFGGVGVSAKLGDRWSASAFYNVNFGAAGYTNNILSTTVGFSF